MTRRIYQDDPYCTEFTATVIAASGEWVELDQTAFYPGGGGQDPDRGTMDGQKVIEVKQEKERVLHKVPGAAFRPGDTIRATVDRARRYDLMRGHSGEHLLFSRLSALNPGIELVKIAITPEKKSIILRGNLDWDLVSKAEVMAREAIEQALPITERRVKKDDPVLQEIRIKIERIHGDEVRIVEIGDIDKTACAGVHVKNTKELDLLLITKFTSAKPAGDYEVEFEVGDRAKARALDLSILALRTAERLGSRPQDALSALDNLQKERERQEIALKRYGAKALAELVPSTIGDVRLYSGVFESMDKKTMMDAANEFTKDRSACVLGSVGERFMLIVACNQDIKVDCVAVLNEALSAIGGKGGGKANFASGGAPGNEGAEKAMVAAIVALRKAVEGADR